MGASGRQIGEKLFALLSPHQKKELARFVRDYEVGDIPANASCTTIFREQYSISQQADQPLTEIQQDDLYFCLEQRLVIVRGQVIPLTVKEFEIFALLILNPKRVINNHVSNLRKKIRIAPDLPDYVKSVYGVGYKFDI